MTQRLEGLLYILLTSPEEGFFQYGQAVRPGAVFPGSTAR